MISKYKIIRNLFENFFFLDKNKLGGIKSVFIIAAAINGSHLAGIDAKPLSHILVIMGLDFTYRAASLLRFAVRAVIVRLTFFIILDNVRGAEQNGKAYL